MRLVTRLRSALALAPAPPAPEMPDGTATPAPGATGKERRKRAADQRVAEQAAEYVADVLSVWPERRLSDTQRREIRDYAADTFGDPGHAPWIEYHVTMRGRLVRGCLPSSYVHRHVVPLNWAKWRGVLAKTLTKRILGGDLFPDVGYVVQGRLYDADWAPVEVDVLARRIFAEHEHAFLKKDDSDQSKEIQRLDRDRFAAAIAGARNAVIQHKVLPHRDILALCGDSGPTLRIMTALYPDGPRAVAGYYSMGTVSTGYAVSYRAVVAPVDMATGRLGDWGITGRSIPTQVVPDGSHTFGGFEIPGFAQARQAAIDLHSRHPHGVLLGFDFGIDEDGQPRIYEVNDRHPETNWSEAWHGPNFDGLGWDRLHLAQEAKAEGTAP